MNYLKRIKFLPIALLMLLFAPGIINVQAQKPASGPTVDTKTLKGLMKAVEKNPDSLSFHEAYIKGLGRNNPDMDKQYIQWMKKYPKSAVVPFAIGQAYQHRESPKAKPYLLKAVEINPKFTEAWNGLSTDAMRWGDFAASREYLGKAAESDPSNGKNAFYYASSFDGVDQAKYISMSLDVTKRFPKTDLEAQILYYLGEGSKNAADKIRFFELLHKSYSPASSTFANMGMSSYFNFLLSENPQKALELAQQIVNKDKNNTTWVNYAKQAQTLVSVKNLISQKKGTEALALLNTFKIPAYYSFNNELALIKAEVDDLTGNTQAAYENSFVAFFKTPKDKIKSALIKYGSKLGKSAAQVEEEIWSRLDSKSEVATPFNLKNYFTEDSTSLADYKGKVVLITYWFPGCAPCRAEFPHFQNVVNKFKTEDLAYVGINIVQDQADYVLPFMKGSGYSFTPLEDVKGRNKGNLENGNAAPVNFLIDQDGRVVYSRFKTNHSNEDELEFMINMLISRK